jgi:septum formation inhibitor MinC
LVEKAKIQYVEPWLLYMGQTLDELNKIPDLPTQNKEAIEKIIEAYKSCGLDKCVEQIRRVANNKTVQAQVRGKVEITLSDGRVVMAGTVEPSIEVMINSRLKGKGVGTE